MAMLHGVTAAIMTRGVAAGGESAQWPVMASARMAAIENSSQPANRNGENHGNNLWRNGVRKSGENLAPA